MTRSVAGRTTNPGASTRAGARLGTFLLALLLAACGGQRPGSGGDAGDAGPDGDGGGGGAPWLAVPAPLFAAEPLPGGDLAVAGAFGAGDFGVGRVDGTGRAVWASAFSWAGGRTPWLATSPDGRVLTALSPDPGPDAVMWVAELGDDGSPVRQQGLATGALTVMAFAAHLDGAVVVALTDLMGRAWVLRLALGGEVTWAIALSTGRPGGLLPGALAVDRRGRTFLGSVLGEDGHAVVALDPNGQVLWARALLGAGLPAPTGDGGVVLIGSPAMSAARLDADGELEWAVTVGEERPLSGCVEPCDGEAASDGAVGPGGETLVVGRSSRADSEAGAYTDVVAVLLDRDGRPAWQAAIRGPGRLPSTTALEAVALDDGRWAVLGRVSPETHWLAALGPDGRLDEPCDAIGSVALTSTSSDPELVPLDDLVAEDAAFEVVDVTAEQSAASLELGALCP